jgi:hypothetical protein
MFRPEFRHMALRAKDEMTVGNKGELAETPDGGIWLRHDR